MSAAGFLSLLLWVCWPVWTSCVERTRSSTVLLQREVSFFQQCLWLIEVVSPSELEKVRFKKIRLPESMESS